MYSRSGRPVQLKKQAAPLLKSLNGRPRAEWDNMKRSEAKEVEPVVETVDLVEDDEDEVNKSPVSSEDESDEPVDVVPSSQTSRGSKDSTRDTAKDNKKNALAAAQSLPKLKKAIADSKAVPQRRQGALRSLRDRKGPSKIEQTDGAYSPKRRKGNDTKAIAVEEDADFFDQYLTSQRSSQPRPSQTFGTRKYRAPTTVNLHLDKTGSKENGHRSPESSAGDGGFQMPATMPESTKPTKSGFQAPQSIDDFVPTNIKPQEFRGPNEIELRDIHDFSDSEPELDSDRELTPPPPDDEVDETQEHLAFIASSDPMSSAGLLDGPLCRCPACNAVISLDLLQKHTTHRSLRWKDKLSLCKAHKLATAHMTWQYRNYPDIDWAGLTQRVEHLRPDVTAILDGKRSSYYHNELEERLSKGNAHNALRAQRDAEQETMTPGYYGPKGAQILLHWLVTNFMTRLRAMARSEKTVKSPGAMGYMQAVLVPELATLLIMEDMDLHEEESAREVLKESAEVGNLINGETENGKMKELDIDDERGFGGMRSQAQILREGAEVVDLD